MAWKLFNRKPRPQKVIPRIDPYEAGDPVYLFTHRPTLENYREFNLAVSKDNIERDKKRKFYTGLLEIGLGAVFLALAWMNRGEGLSQYSAVTSYIAFAVLMIGLGAYTMMFHRFFFERKLEKGSAEYFKQSVYLQHDITTGLYEDGVLEKAAPRDAFFPWKKFQRCWKSENMVYLEFNLANQLFVPMNVIGEAGFSVEEVMAFCSEHIRDAKAQALLDEAGEGDEEEDEDEPALLTEAAEKEESETCDEA